MLGMVNKLFFGIVYKDSEFFYFLSFTRNSMVNTYQLVWFSLFFLFLFLEMGHPGLFYFLAFSCGSLCSYFTTFYTSNIVYQLAAFLVTTTIALCCAYYYMHKNSEQLSSPSHRSNNDALIGQKVIVYKAPENHAVWLAKVSGQVWVVKNLRNESFIDGQIVIIRGVQGCHLRVERLV